MCISHTNETANSTIAVSNDLKQMLVSEYKVAENSVSALEALATKNASACIKKKNVIIIGAGGHGRVVADIVRKNGDNVFGFLDDSENASDNLNIIGKVNECTAFSDKYFIVAIGNNEIRKKIAEKHPNIDYYTAIHPSAVISENVKIGKGTCVMAGAVINNGAKIGEHCIINTNSTVEHDDVLEDFVHVSPGAVLCGTVKIGKNTWVGARAVVKNNVSVEAGVVIGAGAAVVKNITKSGTYIGVPAYEMK